MPAMMAFRAVLLISCGFLGAVGAPKQLDTASVTAEAERLGIDLLWPGSFHGEIFIHILQNSQQKINIYIIKSSSEFIRVWKMYKSRSLSLTKCKGLYKSI